MAPPGGTGAPPRSPAANRFAAASTSVGLKVEILYFEGCPNHEALVSHLHDLVARAGIPVRVEVIEVLDDATSQRERFLGSPTVRVNGRDIEPGAETRTDFGLKCRIYRTPRV